MKSVKVTILGKQYPLKVNPDDEENIHRIAAYVDEKFRLYRRDLTKQPDSTVMVLAALSIAEELYEARRKFSESSGSENRVWTDINESLEGLLREIKDDRT